MVHKFEFKEMRLKGAYTICPQYSLDDRGGHIKDYHMPTFLEHGITHEIKENFYTVSKKGVIRALHFQYTKQQAKFVRCIKGEVYDVLVDLRKDSPTYMEWQGIILNDKNMLGVYVPKNFAHGYLVIQDSIVSYQCEEIFYGEYDAGIRWDDPQIGVMWPYDLVGGKEYVILSEKDKSLPYLVEIEEKL